MTRHFNYFQPIDTSLDLNKRLNIYLVKYLRFLRFVDNCLFVQRIKVAFLGENRILHSNAHHFCMNKYFFIILGTLLGTLINIRKKFVFLFQMQISIFRISCRVRPSKIFFFLLRRQYLATILYFSTKKFFL